MKNNVFTNVQIMAMVDTSVIKTIKLARFPYQICITGWTNIVMEF